MRYASISMVSRGLGAVLVDLFERESTMRNLTMSTLAVAATLATAIGGCASGGESASKEEIGPLDQYWEALDSGQEWDEESYRERDQRVQELIAECMTKEGFEYIPEDTSNIQYGFSDDGDTDMIDWSSLEFAEQYGYGIVDWPGREDDDEVLEGDANTEYVDPNEGYIESLSPPEQEAYWEALYGAPVYYDESNPDDGDDMAYEYKWEENGCWGWADHQVNQEEGISETGVWDDPEFADMLDALQEMSEQTYENNPELTALDAEWVACMADSGHPGLVTRMDAQNELYEAQNELYSGDDDNWTGPAPEQLEAFKAREIEVAVADWKCADKVKYDQKLNESYIKAQEEFVEKHKDTLEAMVAKYGQKKDS